MGTVKIGGRAVPVVGYVPLGSTGDTVPLVDIPMVSDYKWQQQSLQCRLDHPEWYAAIGEDVGATIAQLRRWLEEHNEESAPQPRCYPHDG